jgi:hypothetical protein
MVWFPLCSTPHKIFSLWQTVNDCSCIVSLVSNRCICPCHFVILNDRDRDSGGEGGGQVGPGLCAYRGLTCLTPVLVRTGIAFSPYIDAVVCLVHVLSSELTTMKKKVFDKSLWRENHNFLNVFHKFLLLTVDWLCTARHIITVLKYVVSAIITCIRIYSWKKDLHESGESVLER